MKCKLLLTAIVLLQLSRTDSGTTPEDRRFNQALESGATEGQILEAIEVGIEMGGGPATVFARFALKALEYHASSR